MRTMRAPKGLNGLADGDTGILTAAAQPDTVRGWWRVGQQPVDLSGDTPLEATDNLLFGSSLPPSVWSHNLW